jgi:nucleoside-diphosphate-sugar epimerase
MIHHLLHGMTVLVTGATGFIGGATARRLREEGAVVHGVSRKPPEDGETCDRWWPADVTNIADVRRVLARVRPALVFHLAGLNCGSRALDVVLLTLQANLVAAVNFLVACTEQRGARLVFGGSLEEPIPDGDWPVPAYPYAAAKFGAAAYARMCHALYGTPAVWLRLFMVYGPGQPDIRKLIPQVTLSLLRGEAPALASGRRPVDWVYIDDVVDALLAAAVAEGVEGQTLDVGSGALVTVRDVVAELVRLVNPGVSPRFGAIPDRAREQVRVADVATTEGALGWKARTPLHEGLAKTVDFYRRQRGGVADGMAMGVAQ